MGAVSPNGVGVPAFVAGLRAGRSGCRLIDRAVDAGVMGAYPASERMRSSVAAFCDGFDAVGQMGAHELVKFPRMVPMALAAAREAMGMAGLGEEPQGRPGDGARDGGARDGGERGGGGRGAAAEGRVRIGLVLGTGGGGIDFTLDQAQAAFRADERAKLSMWTITNATHGNLAGELSIRLALRGASLCVSTGCASSSDAVGVAMEQLRSERVGAPDAMVVVGCDAHIRWETLLGMELLRVISTRHCSTDEEAAGASRPFASGRDGFVLGEGAWGVVIERAEHFRRREGASRGARVLGELLGYGATCDAYHRVRPEPSMDEAVRAMRDAMEDGGVPPADVGFVHYHGTGTEMNDRLETEAVKRAFGAQAHRVRGTSVKSMIGHPQGASGLAALVATVAALRGMDGGAGGDGAERGEGASAGDGAAFVPATINLHEPDPVCDLDYTPNVARVLEGGEGASERDGSRVALVNCLAFGAKNSALVVRVGGV